MRKIIVFITMFISIAVASFAFYLILPSITSKQAVESDQHRTKSVPTVTPTQKPQPIQGKSIAVGDSFKITVPNGWSASISTRPSFIAIQFARPSQLESLVYNPQSAATINYDGIPAWSGLTEHFYVRAITASSQAFYPENHEEVAAEPFTFDDETKGTKYSVTKHAIEAKKWGGLLKDNEWYGRVFRYEKDRKIVEAHLAFYPSTHIDIEFFEKVAKSISTVGI